MKNFKQAATRGQQIIIGKMIIPRMKEKGYTRYRIAKITGISETTLSRWFSGTQNISLVSFLEICGALDINPYFEVREGQDPDMLYEYFN